MKLLPETFILTTFCLGLGTLLLIILWNALRAALRYRANRRHFIQCRICSFRFIDKRDTQLAACPKCASLNERKARYKQ